MSRKQPREVRVDALLHAAVEEFLEKGYHGASIDAVARRAGVSKGGFYHHFPNKETLLMEANRRIGEPIERMMEEACAHPSPLNGLRIYIRQHLSYWGARPKEMSFTFLSMAKALENEVLRAYYVESVNGISSFLAAMFERINEAGEAAIPDPGAYALTLMGALDGVLSYVLIHPDDDIDGLAARIESIWLGSGLPPFHAHAGPVSAADTDAGTSKGTGTDAEAAKGTGTDAEAAKGTGTDAGTSKGTGTDAEAANRTGKTCPPAGTNAATGKQGAGKEAMI